LTIAQGEELIVWEEFHGGFSPGPVEPFDNDFFHGPTSLDGDRAHAMS
jgi:hypothetical protein